MKKEIYTTGAIVLLLIIVHVSSVKQKMGKITTIFARFYNELA